MDLPQPVTHDQMYLRAMHDLLVEQNALLADVRDRLPTPEQPAPAVAEPESAPQPESVEVALTEPAVPAGTPVKKTTAASRRTAKKGG